MATGGIATERFDKIEVENAAQLRDWLEANHAKNDGVWLVTYKASTPEKYIPREAVLDELLCFHWIDGIRRKLDDERTMQLITPRKVQHWAKSYKDRFTRLKSEGRLHDFALVRQERDRESGLWSFMDDVDALIVPEDLRKSLDGGKGAGFFDEAAPSYRRNVLRWLKLAKTSATREKRIAKIADASSREQKLPQM